MRDLIESNVIKFWERKPGGCDCSSEPLPKMENGREPGGCGGDCLPSKSGV